jgi:hypothetical protein
VAFGHLRELAKRAGTSSALADSLWATGNHDARVLATLVVGERGATPARLRAWASTLDNAVIADLFARWAWPAKAGRALSAEWIASPIEWIARAGWMIRALHAIELDRSDVPDATFAISRRSRGRSEAKNRVRDAMNMAPSRSESGAFPHGGSSRRLAGSGRSSTTARAAERSCRRSAIGRESAVWAAGRGSRGREKSARKRDAGKTRGQRAGAVEPHASRVLPHAPGLMQR